MQIFSKYTLGSIELQNRIVMAPMTRGRAEFDGTPNEIMVEYYRLRASAGLIVTEATAISPMGFGWYGAPGIYADEHVIGWRKVTDAVHLAGGKIFLQLWHMGRVSHPDFLNGELPVAPSAIAARGNSRTPLGQKEYVTPRALETNEVTSTVEDYAKAAERAMKAGFDGIEIHSANGYLVDQFLRDGTNQRTDKYGGSIENRIRFLSEIVSAVSDKIGRDKTGVRVSPLGGYNDMSDSDPTTLFSAVARLMNDLNIAYLHVVEPTDRSHMMFAEGERCTPKMREIFKGSFMVNGGLGLESGETLLENKAADLIAIGVPFISNPDLVERYKTSTSLNAPNFKTFYSRGREGYLDFPL